jgi:hypothetical protein
MIQFNLLPSVKMEYIKAQRDRRLALALSVVITVAAIALLLLLLSIEAVQKHNLSNVRTDISNESTQLQKEPQINKILTVQNQLGSLTSLHDAKPAVSRLFNSYLNEITPSTVSISDLTVNFVANTVSITGGSASIDAVNQYVDVLKYTNYTVNTNTTQKSAFSNVVLSSFDENDEATDNSPPVTYTITFSYNPDIFQVTNNVSLVVPNIVTTRSELDQPSTTIFQPGHSSTSTSKTEGSQ